MTERVFLSTSEAVHEIEQMLLQFSTVDIDPGKKVVYRQDIGDPDKIEFMGIATGNIPWSIKLDLSRLRPGALMNIRDALKRQLQEQRGSERALEQVL